MKRLFLKVFPYLICLAASAVFYYLGKQFTGDIKSILHGVSGSFLAIPILFLIYDLSRDFSNKKLNKELFDYAKMQIDQDVLSIINQLMKMTLPYEQVALSPEKINVFLSKSEEELENQLGRTEYLGFQVFKSWDITEKNISKVLENPFILEHLENEQTIAIIQLLKVIQSFDGMPKNIKDLYTCSEKKSESFKLEKGENISKGNDKYPDRYLLLRDLGDGKHLVSDFGDFPKYQTGKLLFTYKINPAYLPLVTSTIFVLIKYLNEWVDVSGGEFILNSKIFRPASANLK